MFNFKIDTERLDEVLVSIEILSNKARFEYTENEIHIPVSDEANVAKSDIVLADSAFEEFESGEINIGVPINKLRTIVDLSDMESTVNCEIYPEDHYFFFNIDGQEYEISLIDLEYIDSGIETPDLPRPVEVTIDSESFSKAIASANAFADYVQFGIEGSANNFVIEGSGDIDETRHEFDGDNVQTDSNSNICSKFGLDYMSDLAEAIPPSSDVTISFGEDVPATIEYSLIDGNGSVEYVISPRLEPN